MTAMPHTKEPFVCVLARTVGWVEIKRHDAIRIIMREAALGRREAGAIMRQMRLFGGEFCCNDGNKIYPHPSGKWIYKIY